MKSVQNATDHARCVAARLTGDAKAYDGLPWFWSDQGPDKLQMAGLTTGYDRVVVRGDRGAGSVLGVLLQVRATARHRIGQSRRRSHVRPPHCLRPSGSITPEQAADASFDLKSALGGSVV